MNIVNMDALSVAKMIVLGAIGVLAWQTFNIQVLNREVYQAETKSMVTRTKSIYAERGEILDRNGIVFAKNLRDTGKAEDYSRIFLQGKLASQIVGKVGYDGEGSMGMERMYDLRLRGNEGFRVGIKDAKEREILGRSENVAEAKPGKNLVLTIDRDMQEIVEKALKDGVIEFSAASAALPKLTIEPTAKAPATAPLIEPRAEDSLLTELVVSSTLLLALFAPLVRPLIPEPSTFAFASDDICFCMSAIALDAPRLVAVIVILILCSAIFQPPFLLSLLHKI